MPGFETAWNILFGVPLLLPSFTYLGVHQSHHSLSSYGTKEDPEYLPFASSRRLMMLFAIQSAMLMPIALFVRFLLLAPIGLVLPSLHRWLEVHASSFAMNPEYRRTVSAEMAAKMRRWEMAMLAFWAVAFAMMYAGTLPLRAFGIWLGVLTIISLLNTLRVLGAHEYDSAGAILSRHGQLQRFDRYARRPVDRVMGPCRPAIPRAASLLPWYSVSQPRLRVPAHRGDGAGECGLSRIDESQPSAIACHSLHQSDARDARCARMTHFGIISPPVPGHIHPFAALGRELISRGHRVTYLQMIDLEEKIRSEGLDFEAAGIHRSSARLAAGLARRPRQIERAVGPAFHHRGVARTTAMVCRDAPDAIRRRQIDALLVDQMEPAGGAVADHLGIPFITICNALAINRDPIAPPPFSPWPYRTSRWAVARNTIGYTVSDWLTHPITRVVADYRAQWKLPAAGLARRLVLQTSRRFVRCRGNSISRGSRSLRHFHYVGPLRRARPRQTAFPWERLDGRPLVYASLGTLQNSREPVFRCFADACRDLDVQLVISHGGGLTDAQASDLPGSPLVVRYAPQEELLARAQLTLTHAGLNTVLDSLTHGVPIVAVPITYEQPAIARRVEWHKCGESISHSALNVRRLRGRLIDVMNDPRYRDAAARIRAGISAAGGVERATALIEIALK